MIIIIITIVIKMRFWLVGVMLSKAAPVDWKSISIRLLQQIRTWMVEVIMFVNWLVDD